ncbi:MAG TPA: SET domain-containing protein [Kiloniellaceae bacterium]|nr:SET domain-containing protein [Kiloniellaceae bacterium]
MLRIAAFAGKGRGVEATRAIAGGTVMERAPALRLPGDQRRLIDQTGLFPYYFAEPSAFTAGGAYDCLLAFGSLTCCNHADEPNAAVIWTEDTIGLWAELHALRDIAEAEEVTLRYTNISVYRAADLII